MILRRRINDPTIVSMSSRRLQGHSTSQPRVLRLLNYLGILNLVGIIAILLSEHSFHANHAREQTGPWLISNGKQNPTFIHTNEYKTGRKKNRHKGVNVTLLVLEKAGITIPLDYPRIPPWWWIEDQYGDRPTILGLDRCQQFQQINQNHSHKIQIAPTGLFNSGTNFLHQLLQQNCYFPHRPTNFYHGRAFQPPWGKHTPREARETHRIDHPIYQDMILDAVLPIVLIRHPYDWLKSTCEQPYAVHWRDRDENNTRFFKCPAIVRPNNQTQPVLVTYGSGNILYESVAHLWNRWNRAYFDSIAFPRIMIRMEDLIFYPQKLLK